MSYLKNQINHLKENLISNLQIFEKHVKVFKNLYFDDKLEQVNSTFEDLMLFTKVRNLYRLMIQMLDKVFLENLLSEEEKVDIRKKVKGILKMTKCNTLGITIQGHANRLFEADAILYDLH